MFFGRQEELLILEQLTQKNTSSLVVVKGRRRIGKSSLVKKFAESFNKFYRFEGIAPQKNISNEDQLETFSKQFSKNFNLPKIVFSSWSEALENLAKQTHKGKALILLDEVSWMGAEDPNFAGTLKQIWDTQLKENNRLILVLCGSVSSWIEDNILKHTQFVGRISLVLRLDELKLSEIAKFWGERLNRLNKKDIFKIISITGGVPKYLEEINYKEDTD